MIITRGPICKDNEFLTAEDHERLENEKDEYYYNVYTLGNWGVLGDVIFKNWKLADLSEPVEIQGKGNTALANI